MNISCRTGFLIAGLLFSFNLRADLLTKRYNKVTFITAHNSQSFKKNPLLSFLPGSNISNQTWNIQQQLQHGIRSMKIPVHPYQGQPYACHGLSPGNRDQIKTKLCEKLLFLKTKCDKILDNLNPCMVDPATALLSSILLQIRFFLEENPNEVFTLFLEDSTNDLQALAELFTYTGLKPYLHKQDQTLPWPTLGEMIHQDHRLVVFINRETDKNQKSLDEFDFNSTHFFTAQSRYNFRSILALKKDGLQRPDDEDNFAKIRAANPDNKLWILQHFVTPTLGGAQDSAKIVNDRAFLNNRLESYVEYLGKPSSIWMDFITAQDVANVQQMNN